MLQQFVHVRSQKQESRGNSDESNEGWEEMQLMMDEKENYDESHDPHDLAQGDGILDRSFLI